mgnify:FL=1
MAKKVTLYGIFTALAVIFGYIESLFSLSFIAPGIKLGLANAVCLILFLNGDFKGAFFVNAARILLSALLFSSPFALLFSLTAGMASWLTVFIISRLKSVTAVGFSIAGAAVHNLTQVIVASCVLGRGVRYYLPFLLIAAIFCGGTVGAISLIIFKKIKTNLK